MMRVQEVDPRFDVPLYSIREAAMHLKMPATTLQRWVKRKDLVQSLESETARGARLPFIALVEAQFYLELRRHGLSLQSITTGMAAARAMLGDNFLVKDRLAHDGRDILVNLSDAEAAKEWARARDQQGGLEGVIERGLQPITWADDNRPQRVRLVAYGEANVIADPRFAFGQPILADAGVRTEDILQMFSAGDPMRTVANEFDISPAVVESIVRTHLRAA